MDPLTASTPGTRVRTRRIGVAPSIPPHRPGSNNVPSVPRTISAALSIYEETPEKLRELEKGWRARRKRVLGEITANTGLSEAIPLTIRRRKLSTTRLRVPEQGLETASKKPTEQGLETASKKPNTLGPPRLQELVPSNDVSIDPARLPTPPPTPSLTATTQHIIRPGKILSLLPRPAPHPSALEKRKEHSLRPIIACPLPPTSSPVPLVRARPDTIMVHPPGSLKEMSIWISSARKIHTLAHGMIMEVQTHTGAEWSTTRTLKLDDVNTFTNEDLLQWKTVLELVERFKRQTPRVKMWTELGRLIITCSSPPHIILQFYINNASSEGGSPQVSKVRITHSTLTKTVRIDTTTKPAVLSKTGECFKSSRVAYMSKDIMTIPAGKVDEGTTGELSAEECGRVLGVAIKAWSELECEAVKRLWALRAEWKRYL